MLGQERVVLPKAANCWYNVTMTAWTNRLTHRLRLEWHWMSYLLVFLIAFTVFMILEASPVMADPDSFYHAKMALLIRDHGIVADFPWLRLTTLGTGYTDQHFLYHLLLIPFETIFSPLIGLKIATVVFGSTLITVIYWLLRSFKVRWAMAYPIILLFIRPFTFRIALAKAPSTSLIILIIGIAWIFRYQWRRLFVLAFIYVWYYGGFALLGVGAAVYSGVSAVFNRLHHTIHGHRLTANIRALVRKREPWRWRLSPNWLILLVVGGGLLAGLVFNPYFPVNIRFYEQQLIYIGAINLRNVIGVGAEWYSYNFGELMANGAFASLLMLIAALGIIFRFKKQSKQTWTLFLLTIFFLLLTLKSRRYVEYYIPFAVIFSAFSISDSLSGLSGQAIINEGKKMVRKTWWGKAGAIIFLTYIALGAGYIAGRDFSGQMKDLRSGYAFTEMEPISRWLANNTPAGSRVVHSDWDEFPLLFYHNSHNTYIAGLDPTFLYLANKDTYWTWVNITLGKYQGDVYQAVAEKLGARYVLVTSDHTAMDGLFSSNPKFIQVYHDREAKIYALQPSAS